MNKLTVTLSTAALTLAFGLGAIAPASADQASATRNAVIGGLLLAAGVATEINVANKHKAANSISGYTANGATVYGDGRIVDAGGNTYYPGNNGQTVQCSNGQCDVVYTGNNGYGNGYGNAGYGNYQSYDNNQRAYNGNWRQRH